MNPDAWAVARMAAGCAHVRGPVVFGLQNLPDGGCGSVADRGVVADGEHRGHLPRPRAEYRPYEEHPAVKAAEATFRQPSFDGAPAETGGGEIGRHDDAMLPRCELDHVAVGVTHRAPTGQPRPNRTPVSLSRTPAVYNRPTAAKSVTVVPFVRVAKATTLPTQPQFI